MGWRIVDINGSPISSKADIVALLPTIANGDMTTFSLLTEEQVVAAKRKSEIEDALSALTADTDDEQPEKQAAAIVRVGSGATLSASLHIVGWLCARMAEAQTPAVQLKCLGLISSLTADGSAEMKTALLRQARSLVEKAQSFTCEPHDTRGDKPQSLVREKAAKCLALLEPPAAEEAAPEPDAPEQAAADPAVPEPEAPEAATSRAAAADPPTPGPIRGSDPADPQASFVPLNCILYEKMLSMCMSFNDEEDAAAKGGGDGAVVSCLKMTWAPLRLSQAYHATLVVKNALTAFRKKPGQGKLWPTTKSRSRYHPLACFFLPFRG